MEKYLAKFFEEWGDFDEKYDTSRFAVDLASGAGVFPVAYEKHFRNKDKHAITWIPSEYTNPEGSRNPLEELSKSLVEMERQASDRRGSKQEKLLFADSAGNAVYTNDRVQLVGLSRKEFNGLCGNVRDKDPSRPGRIAVLVEEKTRPISFATSNILSTKLDNALSYEEAVEIDNDITSIKGLRERTINIAVSEENFDWYNNVRSHNLCYACALVTCTSLLTCCGYREPTIWKDTLFVACNLLTVGGYLIQHDTVNYGGFGDEELMRKEGKERGMELVSVSEPILNKHEKMIMAVWKKGGNVHEVQKELEFAWNGFRRA